MEIFPSLRSRSSRTPELSDDSFTYQEKGREYDFDVLSSDANLTQRSVMKDSHYENVPPTAETTEDLLSSAVPSCGQAKIFQAFQRCLQLRDKYMLKALQRLGDDPRDYDGVFPGNGSLRVGISDMRLDGDASPNRNHVHQDFKPWKIYPKPPIPKQQPKDAEGLPYSEDNMDEDDMDADFRFEECEIPGEHSWDFKLHEGVFQVFRDLEDEEAPEHAFEISSIGEYYSDLDYVLDVMSDDATRDFALRRLKYLQNKFMIHSTLNERQEVADVKARRVAQRDFYSLHKVDTHIHHSGSMNQKHLLRFIKSKMKRCPKDVVAFHDGRELTLEQVFQSLKVTAYDLSIDSLDMHSHQDAFHRFDIFNLKFNPMGEPRLREIFMKTDNYIKGRYLAELTREVVSDIEESKYQNVEWRISIYGRSPDEWDKLAKWVVTNKLFSHHVRWLIQVPRLYDVYKSNGLIETFGDIIINIYRPLFEVTKDPRTHPELHIFLQRVVGFDSVDDESKVERRVHHKFPLPHQWNSTQIPPYSYWAYYMYANTASLNNWRRLRGFNTFVFRPHCGEAGDTDHLASAYLTAHSISHGIVLRKAPILQYLFYLKQIGIAMSPVCNNVLFLAYDRNPFLDFFKAGLNVSLSTDLPLQFHFTKEPLLEEYSVATHVYKLSQISLAELARNSVKQSGFEMEIKRHWLGDRWYLPGVEGNDINKTNVPDTRLAYRYQAWVEEIELVGN